MWSILPNFSSKELLLPDFFTYSITLISIFWSLVARISLSSSLGLKADIAFIFIWLFLWLDFYRSEHSLFAQMVTVWNLIDDYLDN